MDFVSTFDIPPIPVGRAQAARQATVLAAKIEAAGDVEAALDEAVQVVVGTVTNDPPSELGRLRLLYRNAYTADEFREMARSTFIGLGLAPPR